MGLKLSVGVRQHLWLLYYCISTQLLLLSSIIPRQLADPDLWGRLSIGALIVQNQRFPYVDIFSYTAYQHPWIDHEWLSGLVFYLTLLWGGEIGLHLLKYGLIFASLYALFFLCRTLSDNSQKAYQVVFWGLFLLEPIYAAGFHPTVRAQVFSIVFFSGYLCILEQVRFSRLSKKYLALLVPFGIFWGNAHGGFVTGVIILALYGIGQSLEKKSLSEGFPYWGVAAAIIVGVGLINPYTLAYWPYLLEALTMPRPNIAEWSPLKFFSAHYLEVQLLVAIIPFFFLWMWIKTGKTMRGLLTPALVILFCAIGTLKAVRFQPFLALAVLAYLPGFLILLGEKHNPAESYNSLSRFKWLRFLPSLLAVGTALSVLLFIQPHYWLRSIVNDEKMTETRALIPYPVGVIQYLNASPYRGNLLNPFTVGEFLYWNLFPRFKVAWDGRYEEVYTQAHYLTLLEFYALHHQQNPERIHQLAEQSGADFVLIETISPNQGIMANAPGWKLIYQDSFYFLYGRQSFLSHQPAFKPEAPKEINPPYIYTIADFFTPEKLSAFNVKF